MNTSNFPTLNTTFSSNENNLKKLAKETATYIESELKVVEKDVVTNGLDPTVSERLKNITKRWKKKVDDLEEKVANELSKLPVNQQKALISYWEAASKFFESCIDWIWDKLSNILQLAWQGVKYVATKVAELFSFTYQSISSAFI